MAATYDLTTNVGKVRFKLGESASTGVLPDSDARFDDGEIEFMLSEEGDDVNRATAYGFEILAQRWSQVVNIWVGPRREELSAIAERHKASAQALRAQFGSAATDDVAGDYGFTAPMRRRDQYS